MGNLPIPADIFFHDFAMDVLEYNVLDKETIIGTYRGLSNDDEDGHHIDFLISDNPQIAVGNTIQTTDGSKAFDVKKIIYDSYNGKVELLKACY